MNEMKIATEKTLEKACGSIETLVPKALKILKQTTNNLSYQCLDKIVAHPFLHNS